MKPLQLSAERLLTTGDNTAIEAWCARCKLYLYECQPHKKEFLNQQIQIAQAIAPTLAKFLDPSFDKAAKHKLLNDPNLAKDTFTFCNFITEHCAYDPLFEAGIKRTVWHHVIPELEKIEAETMNPQFQTDFLDYVKNPTSGKSLTLTTLPQLKHRVQEAVRAYLDKESHTGTS